MKVPTYIPHGSRHNREQQARAHVRDMLTNPHRYALDSCLSCYWRQLINHARARWWRRGWRLRLQEFRAAWDELERAEETMCRCRERT